MLQEELKGSIKSNIKLKMYNGTHITQLGTCAVTIKFKNSKKRVFFVVLGNGQALLWMPDIAALKILNLNNDSIQAEIGSYKTNRQQESHKVVEGCTKIQLESSNKQPTVKSSQTS